MLNLWHYISNYSSQYFHNECAVYRIGSLLRSFQFIFWSSSKPQTKLQHQILHRGALPFSTEYADPPHQWSKTTQELGTSDHTREPKRFPAQPRQPPHLLVPPCSARRPELSSCQSHVRTVQCKPTATGYFLGIVPVRFPRVLVSRSH